MIQIDLPNNYGGKSVVFSVFDGGVSHHFLGSFNYTELVAAHLSAALDLIEGIRELFFRVF